nr:immunoglobulin light chain junction region [Macaca mulatta]MOW32078.1 immunoglobulin light chain junction region [Macaca mulatta]
DYYCCSYRNENTWIF